MSLGGEAPLQFQELRPIPIQQQQLEPISDRYVDGNVAEVGMKEDENESLRNYEIPSQSQLFLPSLFKSSMVEDGSFRQHQQRFGQEQKMETNENQKVSTSPRFQQHQHLQKLQVSWIINDHLLFLNAMDDLDKLMNWNKSSYKSIP